MTSHRGSALFLVLLVITLISVPISMLFLSSSIETIIAGNTRRASLAHQASLSGIAHFQSLNLHAHDLIDMANGQEEIEVIPYTQMFNSEYRVVAKNIGEDVFTITSEGRMLDGGRVIAIARTSARFKTTYREE